jgi:hypothetical protein
MQGIDRRYGLPTLREERLQPEGFQDCPCLVRPPLNGVGARHVGHRLQCSLDQSDCLIVALEKRDVFESPLYLAPFPALDLADCT